VACRRLGVAEALGRMSRGQAVHQAGMDRQTLRDRVVRFNTEGVEGLCDRPKRDRPNWLDEHRNAALNVQVLRGQETRRNGVSTWRAEDLCRLVEQRCGIAYRENGTLRLLHDRGLSWQKARPVHPKGRWQGPGGI
jgi:transposase